MMIRLWQFACPSGKHPVQVLKSLDWHKVAVDVVEVAIHSDAEHDGITLFMEAQVQPTTSADPPGCMHTTAVRRCVLVLAPRLDHHTYSAEQVPWLAERRCLQA